MISVKEAKQIIADNCFPLEPVTIPLQQATGLVIAKTVNASANVPAFEQSAMDGYAFCFANWEQQGLLTIDGEIAAGLTTAITTLPYSATRIFTGAAVPLQTDTVVMQEKVRILNNQLIIEDETITKGSNVRPIGSEIKAGAIALKKGSRLTPAAIGFLTGIGITETPIYPSPKVKIIITGNELMHPGKALQHGQVYESNSSGLSACLSQMHIFQVPVIWVNDDPTEVQKQINYALADCDLLLITGGVSVGDYDFVANALQACGVEKLFHTVRQKPGKPLFAGKRNQQLIFGLPGNPSAALTCFYEYVIPAIEKMMCIETSFIKKKWLTLANAYYKKSSLTHFLKAWCADGKVTILDAQESFKLSSFATANCLVCMEEETEYAKGDLVEVHQFPY